MVSKIKKLIDQLCTDGVEYRPLWQITIWDKRFNEVENYKQPIVAKYKYLLAAELKALEVASGDIKLLTTNNSDLWTTQNSTGDTPAEAEIIAIPWGGNPIIQYFNGKFFTADNRIAIAKDEKELNMKYLYYFLCAKLDQISEFYRGSGIKHPSMAKVLEFRIPVPPISIQCEIVRILDKFTKLDSELEAELKARERQYDFYRDQLLGFGNEGLKWAPFGDVATIVRGASPRPIQNFITDAVDGVPWVKIGDTVPGEKYLVSTSQKITTEGAKNSRYISPGDFILSNSMSFGRPYISKIRGCIHDGWLSISDFEKFLNADYLYHVLQSHAMQMEFSQRASNGTVSNLNADIVKSVRVPLPSLVEQARIAGVLNNFEIMLNSPVEGLPAEIKARRQQYEYYRSKLLTFKELDVA